MNPKRYIFGGRNFIPEEDHNAELLEACELRGKYEALLAEHKRLKELHEKTKERLLAVLEAL